MKKNIKEFLEFFLEIVIVVLVCVLIGIGLAKLEDSTDEKTYNNAICPACNQIADYKLVNVEKRYGLYHYKCSHCEHAIQLHKQIY